MDKVFKAIGRFFKKIWDWIKTTAWVQPLLIVGIIFGIIFSINPIVNAIKGAVNSDDTGKFFEKHSVNFVDLFGKGIEGQKPNYSSKNLLGEESGDVLVIYVTDFSLEEDVASFYNSTKGKDVKLYIVNFSTDENKKSKWDADKKEYVDNSAAYYYDYLLTQLVEAYNDNSADSWRNSYSKAFEADYGYSVFYKGFSDETYDDSSAQGGAADAHSALHLPAAVKYNNGEIVDMRFATGGSFEDYAKTGSTLSNYQVLADLWTGLTSK